MVELAFALRNELAEHVHKVTAHGAAKAAVVEQDDVLVAAVSKGDKVAVYVDLAKFVLDNHDFFAVIASQDVVE